MAGTITIRVNDVEEAILNQAAVVHGLGKSSLMKKLAFEKLEEEYDLQVIADYEKKKSAGQVETRPIESLWKELGL